MTTTQNLSLPQWEENDRIHHDDFNEAFQTLDTMPRIATGSYVGTGEYGEDHPNTLTFDFVPKLVIVSECSNYKYRMIAHRGVTRHCNHLGNNINYGMVKLTWGGDSLTWYCTSGSSNSPTEGQMNKSGTTYYYLAIG